jgi:DNA/RNA-binding domain of Phe-tRNA-synthetase-like protein
MIEIAVSSRWRKRFPGAYIGMLLIGNVDNTERATSLDKLKKEVVSALRNKYAGYDREKLLELEVLQAYKSYYKKFGKTFHLQLQLESILLKGKSLPNVNPLVDANFAAEMDSLLLTAGHDADRLCSPVTIDVSNGSEELIQMNGGKKTLKTNDMMMTDSEGVVCTIIYGQDRRTLITPDTRRALYVTYVPAGLDELAIIAHLNTLKNNVLSFAPDAVVEYQQVHAANRS